MTDLLSIGASGVRAYASALQVVGDNIANAQTPGYARRNARIAEPPTGGDIFPYRALVAAPGVTVTGIGRATDGWLVEDARTAGADSARTSTRLNWLEGVERVLDDGGNGVGKSLTAFYNRADELAADPSSGPRRTAFLQSADDVASAFRRTATGLSSLADATAQAGAAGVTALNNDLTALERVNDGLRRAREGSASQASLLDERDRLLDSIAATLPVDVTYEAKGSAVLTLAGGQTLLSGADRGVVSVAAATDGRLSFTLASAAGTASFVPSGGALGGFADAANHIADQRQSLDTLADSVAAQLNAQHMAGRDASGNAGLALFTTGAGAAGMVAAGLTSGQVAAADGSSANGNALAFGNLRGPGSGEASWATLVAQQSQVVASTRAQDSAATTRRDGAASARDAVSGVDLDREAGELIRLQQAYEASARILQVARETMQSIFNVL